MINFTFLQKEEKYKSFSDACCEAERSLEIGGASTAILCRRAMELAVKWLYSYDSELDVPYQDNLGTLINMQSFKEIIDVNLLPKMRYIQKLGNKVVHTAKKVRREEAVLALKNLFELMLWIDYCYSETYEENINFDESILPLEGEKEISRKELIKLNEKLGEKDRRLEEVISENEKLRKENAAKRKENEHERSFDVDKISEYKTRKIYIDLELELKGWMIGNDCLEEVEVTGMPNETGFGYVDYVLYAKNGKPVAVVEAKKTSIDPKIGQHQAKLYADCLEAKHGLRPAIFYTNGFEFYIWDDLSYPPRLASGVYTQEELDWLIYKRTNKKSLTNIDIKDEISNRPYQKRAINAVCESLSKGNRKSLLVMATGTGKTRVAISIVDVLMSNGWVKNALFLADRRALVKQAKKNFTNLLPTLSTCNLLKNKENPESRMIFSTYPTMMNAIDNAKTTDTKRLFTSGHFDLIIIDESHRSIYKKYQAIFDYFDGILLGLTATPKNDIDKNTYHIFGMADDDPTFSYELEEAVEEGYLTPFSSIETKLKFIEKGIHYDELSEEEKEEFEDTFDDDVKDISGSALNTFLFNENTVDMVLFDLMNEGIKVEGGDRLGKTIIFAKNKNHAEFITERFNKLYPHYKGGFMKAIYNNVKYVEDIIDDFSTKDKLPQIAVSVDMLDTGIDIPEIVNLVIFKKIRSKSKFWQMIGRGTRLCENLFGSGQDKQEFFIFDYCGNFEFFRENPKLRQSPVVKSLTENLFNIKVRIVKELQKLDYQEEEYIDYRKSLIKDIVKQIKHIDEHRFDAKMKLRYIHKYNSEQAFGQLLDSEISTLEDNLSPLLSPIEDDELAKRFDYLMFTIQYASLRGDNASKLIRKVVFTAQNLSRIGNIEKINKQREIIDKVQIDEFWTDANIFDYEIVRKALRDLIKYLEREPQKRYYTDFQDEVLERNVKAGEFSVNDLKNYKKRVTEFLKSHKDDMVIYRLRNNMELTKDDVKHLENILWNDLGTKEEYEKEFGSEPLLKLVVVLVGLDRQAANELFSKFLSDETLNQNQMEFVNMIVNYIIENGIIDKRILNEPPFTKFGSVINLFEDKLDKVHDLVSTIDKINQRIYV